MRPNQQNDIKLSLFYRLSFIALLFLALLPLKSFAQAETCQTNIQSIQAIKSNAKNLDQLPANGWSSIKTLPDLWRKRWPEYSGSTWYQVQWSYQCPTDKKLPITLVISNINMAGALYSNGDFVWQDQSIHEPLSRSWHQPRYWILNSSGLQQGKNILLIQVIGTPTQQSGLGQIWLGEHAKMMPIYKHQRLEKQTLPIFNIMINMVIGFLCLMVWLFIPKDAAFKWFSAVSFLWVIYSGLVIYNEPIFNLSSLSVDKLINIIFCMYTTAGCLAAWRFAQRKFKWIERSLFTFNVIVIILVCSAPDEIIPKLLPVTFTIAVIIFLMKCFTYPYIAYKSKIKESYVLAVQYLFFIPIAINDAHYMLTLEGMILSPYTSPINTLLIGFILALRLANHNKYIQEFNKTLEDSIIQAKESLSISLNAQHQLALENARLQERIHLSHDLHDGLGGSIVRSMILLDHNEKVDKNQMISILKLLRSDLRQVIDSGSSASVQIADDPILWVAPMRHRFVQLFEELNIDSKWTFANTWMYAPSAIQCLTLSRIIEEALTNVIKHSQATEICVAFIENEQQLILEITDNGIGFNPDAVEQGLHIGLQSMLTRVQKIGGQFNLESEIGKTTIQVILPRKTTDLEQQNIKKPDDFHISNFQI